MLYFQEFQEFRSFGASLMNRWIHLKVRES